MDAITLGGWATQEILATCLSPENGGPNTLVHQGSSMGGKGRSGL